MDTKQNIFVEVIVGIVVGVIVSNITGFHGTCLLGVPCYLVSLFWFVIVMYGVYRFICLFPSGWNIKFSTGHGNFKFSPIYRKEKEITNFILLTVINNGGAGISNCFASLDEVEFVSDKEGKIERDEITKILRHENLTDGKPKLQWKSSNQIVSDSGEIYITPYGKADIIVANVLLPLREITNKKEAKLNLVFSYFKKSSQKKPLGLYAIRVRVDGKINNESIYQYFEGYFYANLIEHPIGYKLETDLIPRLEVEVKMGKGDPRKDNRIFQANVA